jgi:hypothetical protein
MTTSLPLGTFVTRCAKATAGNSASAMIEPRRIRTSRIDPVCPIPHFDAIRRLAAALSEITGGR